MNFFRTHITRMYGVATLLVALVLHLSHPVQESTHHNAFTSWLDGRLKTDDDSEVKQRIHDLSTHASELDHLIRSASQLVADHADDFELPFEGSDEDDVYDLLLTEWTSYQDATTGMGKAVIMETNKSQLLPQYGKITLKGAGTATTAIAALKADSYPSFSFFGQSTILSPLEIGIAIGAP